MIQGVVFMYGAMVFAIVWAALIFYLAGLGR